MHSVLHKRHKGDNNIMSRMKGLRHDVITKEGIQYLLFYDIDKPITQNEIDWIDEYCKDSQISYLLIKTKNGHHFIGLTPMNSINWGYHFNTFHEMFSSYYGGIIIRLSLKENEQQELLVKNTTYGEVIPNLYNLYANRFNYEKLPWTRATAKYLLIFEKYRTEKS